MKRGKRLERKAGLKADPEKTRDWQQRSRAAKLSEMSDEERRALVDRGRERERAARARAADRRREREVHVRHPRPGSPLRSIGSRAHQQAAAAAAPIMEDRMVAKTRNVAIRPKTPRQRLAEVVFRGRRPAGKEKCGRCAKRGRTQRATSWHHWLPQEQIKTHVRGRLRDLTVDDAVALLRRLLADERNLIALCAVCHSDHEHTSRKMVGEDVPSIAHEYAAELGPEWSERLRRLYPPGRRSPATTREGGST